MEVTDEMLKAGIEAWCAEGKSGLPEIYRAMRALEPPAVSEDVRNAATALLTKLDVIHADPKYQAVWTLHQIHGRAYNGPTYTDELANLRAALTPTARSEK